METEHNILTNTIEYIVEWDRFPNIGKGSEIPIYQILYRKYYNNDDKYNIIKLYFDINSKLEYIGEIKNIIKDVNGNIMDRNFVI